MEPRSSRKSQQFVRIHQNRIIKTLNRIISSTIFKETGVKMNENGVCGGLTAVYLINKAKGKEADFFKQLKKIGGLIGKIPDKEKSSVFEFCRDVEFAYSPFKYKKEVAQGELDQLYVNKQDGHIEADYNVVMPFRIDAIPDIIKQTVHDGEMCYLSANRHAIGLYRKGDEYYLYDPNEPEGEIKFTDINQLAKTICKDLFVKADDKTITLNLRLFQFIPTGKPAKEYTNYPNIDSLVEKVDPTHYDELMNASIIHNVPAVLIKLKELGQNPLNSSDELLKRAIIQNAFGCLSIMLGMASDATHDKKLLDALMFALTSGKDKAITLIYDKIENKDTGVIKNNREALFKAACRGGNLEYVNKLFQSSESKRKPYLLDAMEHAIEGHSQEVFNLLLKEWTKNNPGEINELEKMVNLAISENQSPILKVLLKFKWPPQKLNNFLFNAILINNSRLVSDLIEADATVNLRTITSAVDQHNLGIIKILLSNEKSFGGEIDKNITILKLLRKVIYEHDQEAFNKLSKENLPEGFFEKLLVSSIESDDIKLMQFLRKQKKINIERDDKTAFDLFFKSVNSGDLEVARKLISINTDINQNVKDNRNENRYKDCSLLNCALMNEQDEMAILLIKHGADIHSLSHYYKSLALSTLIDLTDTKFFAHLIMRDQFTMEDVSQYIIQSIKDNDIVCFDFLTKACSFTQTPVNAHFPLDIFNLTENSNAMMLDAILTYSVQKDKKSTQEKINKWLISSIKNGNIDNINVLLKHGAEMRINNLNEICNWLYQTDHICTNAELIKIAKEYSHDGIVVQLSKSLSPSTKPNRQTIFRSPNENIMLATTTGDLETIKKLLIDNPNIKLDRNSLIQAAAMHNKLNVMNYFLEQMPTISILTCAENVAPISIEAATRILEAAQLTYNDRIDPKCSEILKNLVKYKIELDTSFKIENSKLAESDPTRAKQRATDVTKEKNALGWILHQETPQIRSTKRN